MRDVLAAFCYVSLSSATPAVASATLAGSCVGPAWISDGDFRASSGPDFTVSTGKTGYGPISVYVGCCSEVSDDKRRRAWRIDGVRIDRTVGDHGFSGYLAITRRKSDGDVFETQLHFFGDGLKGDDRDRAFFKRVRFGKMAADRCTRKQDT